MFFNILKAIILGIVHGITEWLPISSTGHMIIVDKIISLNVTEGFRNLFFVVIQLGSILAVVVMYFNRLNPFNPRLKPGKRDSIIRLWIKILIATIPAGIIGLIFDDTIQGLFYNSSLIVAAALIIYGVMFIWIERRQQNLNPIIVRSNQITYKTAALMGLFQVLALIPGTSRSGATILGALILGFSRPVAAEFSFFMAIPVMIGASGYEIIKYILSHTYLDFSSGAVWAVIGQEFVVLLFGFVTAFAVSLFVIRFLMNFIRKHDFTVFGYYRIGLGALIILITAIAAIF